MTDKDKALKIRQITFTYENFVALAERYRRVYDREMACVAAGKPDKRFDFEKALGEIKAAEHKASLLLAQIEELKLA